ncbi:MAG: BrnA antitoxin family protein [Pseudomonadota bacterium]
MKKKEVSYTPDTLPPLTDAQRAHLAELANAPDDQINYDDIPELTDAQLAEFKRPEHYRPIKKQITARLDADVLAWLKAGGKGYQSRMNAILRQAMLNAK